MESIESKAPVPPFLPPEEGPSKLTLVLDLDETLIHHFYV